MITIILIFLTKISLASFSLDTGLIYLELIAPPRPSGMGMSYGSIADDSETIFYNPAGLGFLFSSELCLTYGNYYNSEFYSSSIIYSFSFQPYGTIAFSGQYFGTSPIDKYDNQGNKLNENAIFYNLLFITSYGISVMDDISLGANLKIFNENISRESDLILGLDFGLLSADFIIKNLLTGFSFLNLSPQTPKLGNKIESMPSKIILSSSYLKNNILFSLDFNFFNSGRISLNYGFELCIDKILPDLKLFLRYGLIYLYPDSLSPINFGIGTLYREKFKLDISIQSHYDLGVTYKSLFGLCF